MIIIAQFKNNNTFKKIVKKKKQFKMLKKNAKFVRSNVIIDV